MAGQLPDQYSRSIRSVLNATKECGTTALSIAARNGHATIVEQLLSVTKVLPTEERAIVIQARLEACTRKIPSPLYLAAQHGRLDVIECMIQLLQETLAGRPEAVRNQLVKHMLNKSVPQMGTPLYIAAREGHKAVVECLVAHGANPKKGRVLLYPLGKLQPLKSLLTRTPAKAAREKNDEAIANQIRAALKEKKANTQPPPVINRRKTTTHTTTSV